MFGLRGAHFHHAAFVLLPEHRVSRHTSKVKGLLSRADVRWVILREPLVTTVLAWSSEILTLLKEAFSLRPLKFNVETSASNTLKGVFKLVISVEKLLIEVLLTSRLEHEDTFDIVAAVA